MVNLISMAEIWLNFCCASSFVKIHEQVVSIFVFYYHLNPNKNLSHSTPRLIKNSKCLFDPNCVYCCVALHTCSSFLILCFRLNSKLLDWSSVLLDRVSLVQMAPLIFLKHLTVDPSLVMTIFLTATTLN